jgi:chromosomal replication initiation ATPase DnaA
MYQLKELLKDLGVSYTPELIAELGTKYNVFAKDLKDPLEHIADYVCVMNGISLNDLKGTVRKKLFVNARREYMWILDNLGYKCVTSAKFLQCDHSTIVYHLGDIKDKFSVLPREKAVMIDKYKTLLKDPIYTESLPEMERKYFYEYKY